MAGFFLAIATGFGLTFAFLAAVIGCLLRGGRRRGRDQRLDAAVDAGPQVQLIGAWSALDDVQLNRLLRDAAS